MSLLTADLPNFDEALDHIAERLHKAQRVFVLCGAGLGVGSGLSTFRGNDGYWRNVDLTQLSSRNGFERDPEFCWEWYNLRIEQYLSAKPNAGHFALSTLAKLVPHYTIVTQNIDGLQQRAGYPNVIELHGSIFDIKCTGNCQTQNNGILERIDHPFDVDKLIHEECGGLRRPGVVWFGENLSEHALGEAQWQSNQADFILAVGTSATVEPAASLLRVNDTRVVLAEINPQPALVGKTSLILACDAQKALPALVEALQRKKEYQKTAVR
jgi:NAD-dependent deacetylase